MIGAAAQTAWYVYGVVRVSDARVAGVDAVEHGALAALVERVSLDEFGEDVLPERLNDRQWLEEKARAHEGVLVRAAVAAPVVPLRFGTIVRERDDVASLLARNEESFERTLALVDGRWELGVKGWQSEPAVEDAGGPASGGPASEGAASGRAYLEQRRAERRRADVAAGERATVAAAAHQRLLARAVDGVVNRPQPRELTGRDDAMILNGAYLVERDDDALGREVDSLNLEYGSRGYSFELTGPWPPHNFVVGDDAA